VVHRINPPELGPAPRYSHVVIAESPGRTVFVDGQVSVDRDGRVIGVGDVVTQARVVFEHLGAALRAGGAGWEHLVRVNTYLRKMDHLGQIRAAREQFFDPDNPPGSTLSEVSRLFHSGLSDRGRRYRGRTWLSPSYTRPCVGPGLILEAPEVDFGPALADALVAAGHHLGLSADHRGGV
jgi:enamine deaminase RidA (YjgF/YER057c/UK114 family)